VHEPEQAAAVAGDGQPALGDHRGVETLPREVGAGAVEGAVAQDDALDVAATEGGRLEGGEGARELTDLPRCVGPQRVGLGAHTGTRAVGERDALGDDAARAHAAGRGNERARDLAPEPAGRVEPALDRQRVGGPGEVGQLVDDHLGLRRVHGAAE